MDVAEQLQLVTETILDRMQEGGWYAEGREVRHDRPTPRDINNGFCEDWVLLAIEKVGGTELWLDGFKTTTDWAHCVLWFNRKYYDSLHLNGCSTLKQFIKEAKIAAKVAQSQTPKEQGQ